MQKAILDADSVDPEKVKRFGSHGHIHHGGFIDTSASRGFRSVIKWSQPNGKR
jgi:hypothetical protein